MDPISIVALISLVISVTTIIYVEGKRIDTKVALDKALARIKELEALLGVPLSETELVPGEQYLRIDAPEAKAMIFVKRFGTTVSDPLIRVVAFNSPIESSIPPNSVFSVIQTNDGKRFVFNKKSEITQTTVKTS